MQPVAAQPKKKCIVYVDGFNLYWGILRHFPKWKWLNLQSFFDALRIDDEVTQTKYFTAIVERDRPMSSTRDKQSAYLSALKTLNRVSVIYGKFQLRDSTCKADCKRTYKAAEEKKTDVNIAVNIISDAIAGVVEHIVLVSGDSDLEPAIEWVRKNHPKIKITVYIPCLNDERHKRRNDYYPTIGVLCKFLTLVEFERHQFPDNVDSVVRPADWR
jgi:uncharacterized LabA/DUF88 family protein